MNMIEVNRLTKFYGGTRALYDMSFSVEKGEVLGFLGPNGAGKTTALSILTCLFPQTSGTATVAGYDVLEDPIKVKGNIGYLPEEISLYNDMVVYDYLRFVARLKGIPKKEIAENVSRAIDSTEISDVFRKEIKILSRGYIQRVGIAQALLGDPPILILDEPTIGLDPLQIISIRELIRGLSGERTIILASHILTEVSQVCNRIIIIDKGKLLAFDTPENLKKNVRRKDRLLITVKETDSEVEGVIAGLTGVTRVGEVGGSGSETTFMVESEEGMDIRSRLSREILERGYNLIELRSDAISLEEIFIELVTGREEG